MTVGAGVNSVIKAGSSSPSLATSTPPPLNYPAAAPSSSAAPSEPNAPKATEPEPESPDPAFFQWKYDTAVDEMSGKAIRRAVLLSETTYNFGFPYQGGTFCGLKIKEHPRSGLTVTVEINNGQFNCHSFMNCRVEVRFDDRPSIKFRGVEPASHDSKTIFLEPEKKFLKEIKNSSTMVIELPFYRDGNRIFRFNTANLQW